MSIVALIALSIALSFWLKRGKRETHFLANGKIEVVQGKKVDIHDVQDYMGVGSAFVATGSSHYFNYQIALIPSKILQTPLAVREFKALPCKGETEPSSITALRRQIAAQTKLHNYGYLGTVMADEWRYLALNPQSTDLYGVHHPK